MNELELRLQRRTTLAFIAADPVRLALVPLAKVPNGSGGFKMQPGDPKEEEVFRMIPMGDVVPTVQTIDGVQVLPTFVLMGTFDSKMARWDRFTLNGIDYQIVSPIRPEHTVTSRYWSKADVARR